MRPTWHFVAPEDTRWMLDLTTPRVRSALAFRHRQLELDKKIFIKSAKVITGALVGGKQLPRPLIISLLNEAKIVTDEQRFVHIMMELELEQLVCSGGRDGKQFSYALLDERVPKTGTITRDEALAKLMLRYFTSHGPATLHDFTWWSGLTITDAKAGLQSVKDKLLNEDFEGSTYWFAGHQKDIPKNIAAFLLPNYDEYIISYKDRSASIELSNIKKADPRGTIFNHTIVINGKIEGLWKHTFKKNKVEIEASPFKPFNKIQQKAVETAGKKYAKFLGLPYINISNK